MKKEETLTRKDVREFLQSYRWAKYGIERLDERVRAMELSDTRPEPGTLSGEVAARIALRREALSEIVRRVADVIELLPDGSKGKNIVQMRHLNGLAWKDVRTALHYQYPSTCAGHYRKALDWLLGNESVRKLLKKELPAVSDSMIHEHNGRACKERTVRKNLRARLNQYRQVNCTIQYFERYLRTTELSDAQQELASFAEKVATHIAEMGKKRLEAALCVMDILDFLPGNSSTKVIMEMRYLDDMKWTDIDKALDFTGKTCREYCMKGRDWLLDDERVRKLLTVPVDFTSDKKTRILRNRIRNSKTQKTRITPRKQVSPRIARREKLRTFLKQGVKAYKGIRRLEEFRRAMESLDVSQNPDSLIAAVTERIALRRKKLAEAVLLVMDVIDLLPDGSMEKDILKMRYLEDMQWKQIIGVLYPGGRINAQGKKTLPSYQTLRRKALDALLGYERVQELLDETAASPVVMEEIRVDKNLNRRKQLRAFLNRFRETNREILRLKKRCHITELSDSLQKTDSLAAEFEKRIAAKTEETLEAALRAMDVIDLLPDGSVDKDIMEMRHLSNMGWDEIAGAVDFHRQRCLRRYADALDWLLTHESVRKLLDNTPDSAADDNTRTNEA